MLPTTSFSASAWRPGGALATESAPRRREDARCGTRSCASCASARFSHAYGGILRKAVRILRMARLRHLASQAAASPWAPRRSWQFQLDALTRGRLGACEGASSSQAHAAAVVTEAAASAESALALTAVAVRMSAGMAAVSATALLAMRVERKGVV